MNLSHFSLASPISHRTVVCLVLGTLPYAGLAAPPDRGVQITNTAESPVPVEIVNGAVPGPAVPVPSRYFPQVIASQYQHGFIDTHGTICSKPVEVPEGERFVVESIVANVHGGSEPPNVYLSGTGASIFFPFQLGQAVGDGFPVENIWVSNLHLPIFIGQDDVDGSGGLVRACLQEKGEERFMRVTFWGTLEPAPEFP